MSEWKTHTLPADLLLPHLRQLSGPDAAPREVHLCEMSKEWLLAVVESPPERSILTPPGTVPENTIRWVVCFQGVIAAQGHLATVEFAKDIATKCFLTLSEEGAGKDLVPAGNH